jgi:hypothetical protein
MMRSVRHLDTWHRIGWTVSTGYEVTVAESGSMRLARKRDVAAEEQVIVD